MVDTDNVRGHRKRLDYLADKVPPEELHAKFVGGAVKDIDRVGFQEREMLARYADLDGASVVDVGCGIGRLTRYLVPTKIKSYLGTDVVSEILADAEAAAEGDPRFRFELVGGPEIPSAPRSADIVCGFSVITHLLDEEVFRLFRHTYRVLKPGGVAVYSWLSFKEHRGLFLQNDKTYDTKPDILKFFWPGTLEQFAEDAGLQVIETNSGQALLRGRRETLMNGEAAPESFSFGQCLIALRRAV